MLARGCGDGKARLKSLKNSGTAWRVTDVTSSRPSSRHKGLTAPVGGATPTKTRTRAMQKISTNVSSLFTLVLAALPIIALFAAHAPGAVA
jgi:hypothetical protein